MLPTETRAEEIRGRLLGALIRTWPMIGPYVSQMSEGVNGFLALCQSVLNLPGPLRKLLPLPEQVRTVLDYLSEREEAVRSSLEALQYLQKSGQDSSVDPGVLGQLLNQIPDDLIISLADAFVDQVQKVGPVLLWVTTGELPQLPPPELPSTTDGSS
jgi:hypothetical protein